MGAGGVSLQLMHPLIPKILKGILFSCLLMLISSGLWAQTAEVKGFLYDKKTGEAVIFSPVLLEGTIYGVNTDINGYFAITKVPAGTYTLVAGGVGYTRYTESITLEATRQLSRKIYLEETAQEIDAVEIEGSRSTFQRENTVNVGLTQITPKDIKINPSVGGEPDLAQYIQTVPGVVSTGDQGGQVFIRGGTLTQNLTLLDGMVIYNPFHSIGLYSIFDTDILKSADFYTAGFGAEYGGRASSVIDARTIDGNKNTSQGRVSINPVAARLNINGPIFSKDNGVALTYLASARHSYLDKVGPELYPYASKAPYQLGFGFTDFFGKLTLTAGSGAKVSLSGFDFRDKADIGSPNRFKWNNSGLGLNFLLLPGNSTLLLNGTFAYSTYKIGILEANSSGRQSTVDGFNGGLDFTYFIGKSELKYGLGVIGNNTSFSSPLPTGEISSYTAFNTELYGFAHYRINGKNFILDPGVRIHYYASLSQPSLEPRIGGKLFVKPNLRLKASGGLYSQNLISTRSDRDVISLFNGFISSPDNVFEPGGGQINNVLQRCMHYVAGVEYDPMPGVELDLEGYVKDFSQFININIARRSAEDPVFVAETGLAQGIDLTAKYGTKRGSVKLSYSLARVTRGYGDTVYNPNYDRRHNLNILVSYYPIKTRRDFELDVRFNFGSGFPFTQTQGFYENVPFNQGVGDNPVPTNGNLGIYYGTIADYNKGRLPFYHRLDVGLKKYFVLTQRTQLEVNVGATNLYNRANVFYIDRTNLARKVNQLPILPYVAVSATF
jgi:hypothetical protein